MTETTPEISKNTPNKYQEDLKRGLSVVENKERALNSKKAITENSLKQVRANFIKQIFSTLHEIGVNPADPASINQFLTALAEKDPDLLLLFETAFNGILGEEDLVTPQPSQTEGAPQEEAPALTNNFDNLRNMTFNR